MIESRYQAASDLVHRLPLKRSRSLGSEIRRWTVVAFLTGIGTIGLLGGSLVAAIYLAAHSDQERQVDAIVVMGAAQFNGVPSAVLKARLDTTLRVWSDGIAPIIIVTGGKMPGDKFTESESSRDYLVERGVPESAILMENESRNTEDSVEGVAEIARNNNIKTILIVSDGFHLFRSKLIADHNNLTPSGVASDASPIESWSGTEFEYVLREAAGVIAYLAP